ncbi:MAG: hypothetical protein MUF10_02775 [Thermoanaerobaculaceae bacterium]|jgi:hypothetical protein|nr:hypothetical protein [Thermoanaerobaculaceae bacterium]
MRGFLAVAQREVVERRMWLVAAVVAGLIPLAGHLLPWVSADNAVDARVTLALVLASSLLVAGSLLLGISMIGTELGERRLGFHFARPLSAAAIWWGKLTASFLVVMLVGVLVLLPTALVSGRELPGRNADDGPLLAGLVAVFVLLVLLVGHALSVAGRSRSWLLTSDLVAALLIGAIVWAVAMRFWFADSATLFTRLVESTAFAVLVGLAVAGWVQVAVGRTDARRGHRALSATLWGTLGVFALAIVGYAAWVFSATPSSLGRLSEVMTAPGGSWTLVSGSSAGRGDFAPTFLLDTQSGRWLRFEVRARWWVAPMFSADGRTAVWLQQTEGGRRDQQQVLVADLSASQPRAVATSLVLSEDAWQVRLSRSGRRLAVIGEKNLSVYSLPDGGLVRAVRVDVGSGRVGLRFLGEDELVYGVWAKGDWLNPVDVVLRRLDIPSGRLEESGKLNGARYRDFVVLPGDPRGELLLAFHPREEGLELVLHDARTGAARASLLSQPDKPLARAAFLFDGRIVVGESPAVTGGPARVHLFDREGRVVRTIALETDELGRIGSEVAPGVSTVSLGRDEYWGGRNGHAVLVNVDQGSIQNLPEGYLPVPVSGWWSPGRVPAEPGGACARLFRSPEGALVRYEPTTGGFTTILATRWPS